eukprot:5173449-Pyramimonas_sp.AAC.1
MNQSDAGSVGMFSRFGTATKPANRKRSGRSGYTTPVGSRDGPGRGRPRESVDGRPCEGDGRPRLARGLLFQPLRRQQGGDVRLVRHALLRSAPAPLHPPAVLLKRAATPMGTEYNPRKRSDVTKRAPQA